MLIAIFVLLLVCVVAIALVVASGTESALSGNYRSATSVYYAALAGLEEGRGRLLPKNPDYYLNTQASFVPQPGTPMVVGAVSYVLNPAPGETVAPWDTGTSTTYPDLEYSKEFPTNPLPTSTPLLQTINSTFISNNPSGLQGPLYKWVRINAVTEQAMQLDVNSDGTIDTTTPIYYDGAHLNLTSSGGQVLEITSLAVLPNGTQKLLQYLVAPNVVSLPPFPAAVTLVGRDVDYTGPDSTAGPPPSSPWFVKGDDTISLGSCTPGSAVYAIGYSDNDPSDPSKNNIDQGTFTKWANNYTGQGGTTPNLGYIGGAIPPSLQTANGLNGVIQKITQIAQPDGNVITGPINASKLPATSASNPKTIVVNGDLDFTGWHNQGFGLLLVTGTLTYDPDASWYGIIMVIGKGRVVGTKAGSGQIVGALFVSQIYDATGSLYSDPNNVYYLPDAQDLNIEFAPTMGGVGIYYSSCWIKAATPAGTYQMLSFHEISQ